MLHLRSRVALNIYSHSKVWLDMEKPLDIDQWDHVFSIYKSDGTDKGNLFLIVWSNLSNDHSAQHGRTKKENYQKVATCEMYVVFPAILVNFWDVLLMGIGYSGVFEMAVSIVVLLVQLKLFNSGSRYSTVSSEWNFFLL